MWTSVSSRTGTFALHPLVTATLTILRNHSPPQVRLDHMRVVADLFRLPLGDLLPEVEDRDPVRVPHVLRHLVLDQHDGYPFVSGALDESHQGRLPRGVHPC